VLTRSGRQDGRERTEKDEKKKSSSGVERLREKREEVERAAIEGFFGTLFSEKGI